MKSNTHRYGTVAVTIHWITAILIVALLGSGFRADMTIDPAAKASILTVHAPLGIAILLLTIFRVFWWNFADKKPAPPSGDPAWQASSAKLVYILFYVVIFMMAGSGIALMVLTGAGAILFAGAEGPLPDFQDAAPRAPHGIGARVMIALLVLHVGAALYHHFGKKDGLLRRMWYGSGTA